jgi:hypothetical protein
MLLALSLADDLLQSLEGRRELEGKLERLLQRVDSIAPLQKQL